MTSRSLSLCAGLAILFDGAFAYAQQLGPVTGGYVPQGMPAQVSPENGLLLSDSALLHVGGVLEGGYDSNVFYEEHSPAGAPFLRMAPFVEITNTARNGAVPSGLFFDARATLAYRAYLSSNDQISKLSAFSPSLNVSLEHNSNGTVALGFMDIFSRVQDAPYTRPEAGAGQLIIRDNNLAAGQIRWAPGGGRIQGILRLSNIFDWFEYAPLRPASSMTNELMVDASWRWLPKTALFLQVRQGYTFYFDDTSPTGAASAQALVPFNKKSASFPLRAMLGIRGLITEKTSIALAMGYINAFYANGTSTGGFLGSTLLTAELIVMPILPARITFGLRHDFQNSVLGNFYYDDGAYLSVSYMTVSRLVGNLWGSYDHKRFYGLPPQQTAGGQRTDDFVQAGAMLDYYMRTWLYAGASYTLALNESTAASNDLTSTSLSGTTYTKHQVFARLGITY